MPLHVEFEEGGKITFGATQSLFLLMDDEEMARKIVRPTKSFSTRLTENGGCGGFDRWWWNWGLDVAVWRRNRS